MERMLIDMKMLQVKGLDRPVSELWLGTSWFAPEYEKTIYSLLERYIDLGGNVIDTGKFYNGGKAETILAKWLKEAGLRDKIMMTNKACHHYVDSNNVHHPEMKRVKPQYITEDLESSLKKLNVSYIDIYLLHRDDPEEPLAGLMDRLEKHYKEGKIKAYGVSNWSLQRVQEAIDYCKQMGYQGLSINNPSYSLATVKKPRWVGTVYADQEYAEWHKGKNILLASWASQAAGFFADIYKKDGSTPQDIVEAYFSDDNFEKLERCKELAKIKGVEPINIALAYVLNQDFPVAAIVGPRKVEELLSVVKVLDIQLSSEEIDYLALNASRLL
jgi:aryl-alcohol dehydrogenase-like predicted oxidoreductase